MTQLSAWWPNRSKDSEFFPGSYPGTRVPGYPGTRRVQRLKSPVRVSNRKIKRTRQYHPYQVYQHRDCLGLISQFAVPRVVCGQPRPRRVQLYSGHCSCPASVIRLGRIYFVLLSPCATEKRVRGSILSTAARQTFSYHYGYDLWPTFSLPSTNLRARTLPHGVKSDDCLEPGCLHLCV
eukprot:50296-Rhodomonas_salina.5